MPDFSSVSRILHETAGRMGSQRDPLLELRISVEDLFTMKCELV